MNKKILISLFSFLIVTCSVSKMQAQVTIGSANDPAEGALLDLKQNAPAGDNSTATKGMLQPRVALTNKNDLTPMYPAGTATAANKAAHTGLIVYNVTSTGDFTPGLHIWDGTEWRKLADNSLVSPAITDLACSSAVLSPQEYTAGTPYNGLATVPYLGGNGGFYSASAMTPVTSNGLTFTLEGGQLAVGAGSIVFKVTGTPIQSSDVQTTFAVNFLGKSCSATVGGAPPSLMKYQRRTALLAGAVAGQVVPGSEVQIGNLKARYVYLGGSGANSRIEFSPKINTFMTYLFSKSGSGQVEDLERYGQVPAAAGAWYNFSDGNITKSAPGGTTNDLNPVNRDIGTATIVIQNNGAREVYRITCNAYTTISTVPSIAGVKDDGTIFPANAVTIPTADGSVTLFVEFLE